MPESLLLWLFLLPAEPWPHLPGKQAATAIYRQAKAEREAWEAAAQLSGNPTHRRAVEEAARIERVWYAMHTAREWQWWDGRCWCDELFTSLDAGGWADRVRVLVGEEDFWTGRLPLSMSLRR